MNKNLRMFSMSAFLCFGLTSGVTASADALSDAKAMKNQYFGKFQIDAGNPGVVKVETLIPNQQVELMVNSSPPPRLGEKAAVNPDVRGVDRQDLTNGPPDSAAVCSGADLQ